MPTLRGDERRPRGTEAMLQEWKENTVRVLCLIISFYKMVNYFDRNPEVLKEEFKGCAGA